MKRFTSAFVVLAFLIVPAVAAAAVPGVIPVQGILTDSEGTPLESNVAVTFTLYDAADTELFQETLSVTPEGGFFSVELGADSVALDLTIFRDNTDVELGIQVGADDEMTPRLRFGSVPYAVSAEWAADADTLGGLSSSEFVQTDQADSITSDMIVDGTITNPDLSDAVPLYEVQTKFCENPEGTLTTSNECYANQKFADSCSCTTSAPRKFRKCDGTCGCGLFIACINPPCDPRLGIPKCPNQPIVGYGVAP